MTQQQQEYRRHRHPKFHQTLHLIIILLIPLYLCHAIPFGTRGGNDTNDVINEDAPVQQEITHNSSDDSIPFIPNVRGGSSTTTEITPKEAIDQYFESPFQVESMSDDPSSIALQKLLRSQSSSSELYQFLQNTRRKLHKHAELMYQESYTSSTIISLLDELDIDYTTGWATNIHNETFAGPGGYGIVATLGSGDLCLILRADMDALPIVEQTHLSFQSNTEGTMHACGHDGHVTMLLGAVYLLKQMELQGSLTGRGTIRIVFQPAEEGGAGMKRMIEEGLLRNLQPKAQVGFGLHVWPSLPSGIIASRPGPLLAAAEIFEVTVTGKGGHAAMPHQTIDPIVASSSIIMTLQTLVSRSLSPLANGVVSITQVKSGDGAYNVIPSKAVLRGTLRALSVDTLLYLKEGLERISQNTAHMYGCTVSITYSPDYYPPTFNDVGLFKFSTLVGEMVSHDGTMLDNVEATMAGEDFAFLAQEIPCTFFLLGQGGHPPTDTHPTTTETIIEDQDSGTLRTDYGLHHPHFTLDEHILPKGVELHVNLVIRTLKMLKEESLKITDQQVFAMEL